MWPEIEAYIRKNRQALDVEEPRPELWGEIEKKLDNVILPVSPRKHFFMRYPYWKVAAIVLVTVGLCYIIFTQHSMRQRAQVLSGSFTQMTFSKQPGINNPEVMELESYYFMEINQRLDQLEQYELDKYHFVPEFLEELAQAEQSYLDIKQDFLEDGVNERLVSGMIATYELKIKILEQLLQQIQESQQTHKSNKHM